MCIMISLWSCASNCTRFAQCSTRCDTVPHHHYRRRLAQSRRALRPGLWSGADGSARRGAAGGSAALGLLTDAELGDELSLRARAAAAARRRRAAARAPPPAGQPPHGSAHRVHMTSSRRGSLQSVEVQDGGHTNAAQTSAYNRLPHRGGHCSLHSAAQSDARTKLHITAEQTDKVADKQLPASHR